MVLLKTTVVVLLVVACVSAGISTVVDSTAAAVKITPQEHAVQETVLPVASTQPTLSGITKNGTTVAPPTTTSVVPPTTTNSSTTGKPTTPTPVTTTTTTTTTPIPSTSTSTPSPIITTTTLKPNVTTALPPTPEPSPARSWDGPSFLGGMVLAFGIVAVGFVGYRFFYLGRGGAYHTL